MNHLHIRHFKNFVFSHFTLIDTHLERLKEGMEEALLTRAEPQKQNIIARAIVVSYTYCTSFVQDVHVYVYMYMYTYTCNII